MKSIVKNGSIVRGEKPTLWDARCAPPTCHKRAQMIWYGVVCTHVWEGRCAAFDEWCACHCASAGEGNNGSAGAASTARR